MKKINIVVLLLVLGFFIGCLNDDDQDKEKIVEMTIYPEIGYGGSVMSDTYTEQMIFSESNDTNKRQLSDIITEGFDFDYKLGYDYTFKANKIWMSNPPQDVSSIRYEFIGPLNKQKAITEDREETLNLTVFPDFVKFHPRFSETGDSTDYKVYDALLCRDKINEKTFVLREVEGFDFEEGHSYELQVKRKVTANPYAERFILDRIINKVNDN